MDYARVPRPWIAAASLTLLPVTAIAQDQVIEEVIVTGSYIKGSPEDAPSPVQSLQRDEIAASRAVDVAEVMRNLEIASGSDTAPSDALRFNGAAGAGLANVNLRGLGPTSTLVLLDGKRMPYAGQKLSDGDRFVDINSIPITMIERVEVLKNGASATYGSDAIAGVVRRRVSRPIQHVCFGPHRPAPRPVRQAVSATLVNRFTFTGGDPLCNTADAGFFYDNGESSDPFSRNRDRTLTEQMIPEQERASVMADFSYEFAGSAEL